MPAGYQHDRWEADLGSFDAARFARAADALRHWEPQAGAGLTIFPGEDVAPGATFALVIRLPGGPLPDAYATAAGRVVYVIDEPAHYGFAYGTLPAHPEQGEEAFHVERDGSRLRFRVTAFSRPRHPLARLGTPVSRILQRRTIQSYLLVMRQVAQRDPS